MKYREGNNSTDSRRPAYQVHDRRSVDRRQVLLQHIDLQLASLDQPPCKQPYKNSYLDVANSLLKNYRQHRHLLADYRCPADQRIEAFLNDYLKANDVQYTVRLPGSSFILGKAGLARELSLPASGSYYKSDLLSSYRVAQGVLHNPKNDRRTTAGVFHIVGGGLPIPLDKRVVPVEVYAKLLDAALNPPDDMMVLPITAEQEQVARSWVSLYIRPLVRPEINAVHPAKTMETRIFAPGGLTANIDFIESIFGNAGDPFLAENDAALDIEHWTGHSGCIILAPHLTGLRKKDLGLPHYDEATRRQRDAAMCWQHEDEYYNDGNAFKVVCRDMHGVIVTIIADNYFGYSKKEIKSHISYSANLSGGCEEEHAGGAIAFPRFNLGETYYPEISDQLRKYNFATLCNQLAPWIEIKPEGYAIDRIFRDILYIPENAEIHLQDKAVRWQQDETVHSIKLLFEHTYIYPSGFMVHMEKHPHAPSWRLIGTLGEGTFCHKPNTVSGGGKSEISKSISSSIISGPVYVDDFDDDLDQVEAIIKRDYCTRFRSEEHADSRALLSPYRSLGSVIQLLTPSSETYTDEYNQWLLSIPPRIIALVYMIKRFYKREWGDDWRKHFSVDETNGHPAHELKFDGRKLIASYLRVGMNDDDTWRVYKLRQDFIASEKLQMEDDITVSTVIPVSQLDGLNGEYQGQLCVKIVDNCEARLFQRPDVAVNRGFDLQTEADLSTMDNFISNFEPLTSADAREIIEDIIHFDEFSRPMKQLISNVANEDDAYFVSSAHPRMVDGKPSLNVRYLQLRPDLANPRCYHLAVTGTRLSRRLYYDQPVYFPVNAVLQGRRNNPPDANQPGVRSLAVYNPVHYQELPELFMDLICSLTGRSPSTTGAGSEGALTKGPFNALQTTADLNTALVSYILCGYQGFSTAAGYIGPIRRVDHDISMLIPEIWSRIPVAQRKAEYLIANGLLEKINDFNHRGKTVLASRLGYRITKKFTLYFLGKIFDNPTIVFDEAMLKPETQDLEAYVDGINNITEAYKCVAQAYFDDGSIADACPPLQALLHIMVSGEYQGKSIEHHDIRSMFTRDYLLQSDWYAERLRIRQTREVSLWVKNHRYLKRMLENLRATDIDTRAELKARIEQAENMIKRVSDADYLNTMQFTLGTDWIHRASSYEFKATNSVTE
ncbi:MAG: hypothetical protein LJE83_04060 [Gammaproteobacteria bacterium]|nr:hypothetical protein [Gammaproteobacteria bacterium]